MDDPAFDYNGFL